MIAITRQDAGVKIQGTVTDANGLPLSDVLMQAQTPGENSTDTTTDSYGHYLLAGLLPGKTYTLYATPPDSQAGTEIYPHPVIPTVDGTVVNMALSFSQQGFAITGTVTSACGDLPVVDAQVVALFVGTGTQFYRTTYTDTNGVYSITGLPEYTDYTLSITPTTASGLRRIDVGGTNDPSSPVITQDVQIVCGQGISGTVRLVNVSTQAYAVLFDVDNNYVDYIALQTQNADGDYTFNFANLPDGGYKLVITANDMEPLWYQNSPTFETATAITPGGPAISMTSGCYDYYYDFDNDGYGDPTISELSCSGPPSGFVLAGNDCDDTDANINPGATEIFGDNIDNNCNGVVDESDTFFPVQLQSNGGLYDSVQNAYDDIVGTDTIQMQLTGLVGNLTFDRDVIVTLKGGYDDTFTYSSGNTVISAPVGPTMVIKNGTVIIDNITIR